MVLIKSIHLAKKPLLIGRSDDRPIVFIGHNISSNEIVNGSAVVVSRAKLMLLMQLEKFSEGNEYNNLVRIVDEPPDGDIKIKVAPKLQLKASGSAGDNPIIFLGWRIPGDDPIFLCKGAFMTAADLEKLGAVKYEGDAQNLTKIQ